MAVKKTLAIAIVAVFCLSGYVAVIIAVAYAVHRRKATV